MMVEFDAETPATYVRPGDDTVAKTIEVVDAYCTVDLSPISGTGSASVRSAFCKLAVAAITA
jgi:hypothetical protein